VIIILLTFVGYLEGQVKDKIASKDIEIGIKVNELA
jgi:hypothetical protein